MHVIYDCFPELDCDATANKLQSQLNTLVNLNYDAMSLSLFSQSIITRRERQIINDKCGEEKMEYLLADIIIPSLRVNVYGKYKGFLKAMEESDDSTLKSTAKNLGMYLLATVCTHFCEVVFKPGTITFIRMCMYLHICACVCVCVSTPKALKVIWHGNLTCIYNTT